MTDRLAAVVQHWESEALAAARERKRAHRLSQALSIGRPLSLVEFNNAIAAMTTRERQEFEDTLLECGVHPLLADRRTDE